MNPTMMLINAEFGINHEGRQKQVPTFALIPIDINCPYSTCIFDPSTKALGIVSKIETHPLRMLPKADDNGDVQYTKNKQPRPNGKQYKEERRAVDSFQEYELIHLKDIEWLVDHIAVNANEYDYKLFFVDPIVEEPTNNPPKSETPIINKISDPIELKIVRDESDDDSVTGRVDEPLGVSEAINEGPGPDLHV